MNDSLKVQPVPAQVIRDLDESERTLESIHLEIEEYKWRKANELKDGAFTRRQAE